MDNFTETILSFAISAVLGMTIALIYRTANRGFSYDANLRSALLFITLIVTMIMSVLGSNIALSLGLIGSLSIIRFRTAIKSVVDMVFLFWAIAAGLGAGAGSYTIAIGGTIFIGILFILLDKFKFLFPMNDNYILIINYKNGEKAEKLNDLFAKYLKKVTIKSSNIDKNKNMEIVYNISFVKNANPERFIEQLQGHNDLLDASLLSPNTNLYV